MTVIAGMEPTKVQKIMDGKDAFIRDLQRKLAESEETIARSNDRALIAEGRVMELEAKEGMISDEMLDEMHRYQEALKFYADSENWKEQETGIGMSPSDADMDCGNRARAALKPELDTFGL